MKAAQRAYNSLRADIIKGSYPPGTRVTEQEVVASSGVSRTPVREALQRLETEGLLTFGPHQGAIVASWSNQDADDIFQLRMMVESHAARLAAERATGKDIEKLKALAEEQYAEAIKRAPEYLERVADLNSQFHRRLMQAAASSKLQTVLTSLSSAPLVLQTFRDYEQSDLNRSAQHHLELAKALEVKDGDWAASVMRSHILAARSIFNKKHQSIDLLKKCIQN